MRGIPDEGASGHPDVVTQERGAARKPIPDEGASGQSAHVTHHEGAARKPIPDEGASGQAGYVTQSEPAARKYKRFPERGRAAMTFLSPTEKVPLANINGSPRGGERPMMGCRPKMLLPLANMRTKGRDFTN